jgi:uncharacterized repeat protein (TIGR01451 family)
MCGPQVYEAMARAWSRRDFLKMLSGAMAATVLPSPGPTVWPWLSVEIQGAREGDLVSFTLTVRNLTEETISDLYVAGHVPRNADFVAATATPPGPGSGASRPKAETSSRPSGWPRRSRPRAPWGPSAIRWRRTRPPPW